MKSIKTVKTIAATIILSLPLATYSLTSFAEGGYVWEQKAKQKHTVLKESVAKKMGHTASEHKYFMTEAQGPVKHTQQGKTHSYVKPHSNHMAVDHKRESVGTGS